ncbi:ATP-binding protein [Streptomyces chiangmaiensis]|uniref:ATP-binding protein n=1 Tax=Streptomyces chiangmaiensis TaxID=766497 RepID=A0ABU7FTS2_9ACTN|nr:hypothetical protein [Streptomyces chiangmaiensis]MED7826494.1 hypothetical protein [Streptomyces chiangmaiensis]
MARGGGSDQASYGTFDEGGRGLFVVAQLAQRRGTRHGHHGKTIRAEPTTGSHLGLPA